MAASTCNGSVRAAHDDPHANAEGDDRDHVVIAARGEDPTIVVKSSDGELSVGGLDACPLDAEAEGIQPEAGEQGDIVAVVVKEVACVA